MNLNLSVIMFVKITCHRTFWLFFLIPSFSTLILLVYTERICLLVFTDGHCKDIFNQRNSLQFTNENILSVCPFVFANFLVVTE
jgi:hypothetical protein